MRILLLGVEYSTPAVMLGPAPGSTSRFDSRVPAKRKSPLPENLVPSAGLRLGSVLCKSRERKRISVEPNDPAEIITFRPTTEPTRDTSSGVGSWRSNLPPSQVSGGF